jgi:DNA polymerase-3 subunit chi
MTAVAFHSGLSDKLGYACRLLRKAYRQGSRVLVTAPAELLMQLDRELWTFEAGEFVPHLLVDGRQRAALQARTPIWLVHDADAAVGPEVLVNLGSAAPADPGGFERIVELVSLDADDRRSAHARWRAYEAAGLTIDHHPQAARA